MAKIAIIGGGEIGGAIYKVLTFQGEDVGIWDKDKSKNKGGTPQEILSDSEFIFFCVPSWALRSAAQEAVPLVSGTPLIISLAKGMEESGKTADQILQEVFPDRSIAVLGGPMIAEEISSEKEGVAVFGTDEKSFNRVKPLFENSPVKPEHSLDMHGVAVCGVLKNIYALGLGISDALELGDNFKGWFAGKASEEMLKIVPELGGKEETVFTAAGAGDLLATGYSIFSKNRDVGMTLVKTGKIESGEGSVSIKPLTSSLQNIERFPLLAALSQIFINNKNAAEIFAGLWK